MSAQPLVIVGASIRAAAWSAQRAGYEVWGGDLFADRDARHWANLEVIVDYPAGLARIIAKAPAGPWLYTGGIENYPELVAAWSARRPLWGNSAAVLQRARDPDTWCPLVAAAGLSVPRWQASPEGLSVDGRWLAKRRRGSGGLGVVAWRGQTLSETPGGWCFQEFVPGQSCAALYVAGPGRARCLGLTAQISGEPWTGARGFQYAGSLGPLPIAPALGNELDRLGATLAGELGLRGVFGVDGLVSGERFWPVEINPRYTSSMELVERATGESTLTMHAAACEGIDPREASPPPDGVWGKAIVYAAEAVVIDEALADELAAGALDADPPRSADVPPPGTRVETGWPVCTLLSHGATPQEVRGRLQDRAQELRARLTTV